MIHLGATYLFVAEFINMNRFHLHFYAVFGAIRLNIQGCRDPGINIARTYTRHEADTHS